MPQVERIAAFSRDPLGGNPAGVVLSDTPLADEVMQAIAADVGYSETAFAWPGDADQADALVVRYFSPVAEVPFCGHATIATGAVLAERHGPGRHRLLTRAGEVRVDVDLDDDGPSAALVSVAPAQHDLPGEVLEAVLEAFGWGPHHLDPERAPVVASAGARHLLLPVRSRAVLAEMAYDFEAARELMVAQDLTTIAVLWRQDAGTWHVRNAFPVGGVVEDPATGAAAAAIGGWLRATGQVEPPADLVLLQGEDLGRPSRLDVHVPAAGGITVAGRAVRMA